MRVKLPAALLSLSAAALLAACSHQEVPDAQANKKDDAKAADAAKVAEKSPTEAAAEYKAQGQAELNKAMDRLKEVSVFFEFDDSTLTKPATDALAEVGSILVKHPELKINIAGHADERGTPDYNLALGQRRAASTKAYLSQMGVKADQIEKTISYGSEKPRATGHDEEAWKQNRRGDVEPADTDKK